MNLDGSDRLKWSLCDSRQLSILQDWCFSFKQKKVFPKPTGNCKQPILKTLHYVNVNIAQSLKLEFWNFLWVLKKTFLCLILKHQCGNMESCLESQIGHFRKSHTPRFRPKKVLFYLIKRQNCCFEWSI